MVQVRYLGTLFVKFKTSDSNREEGSSPHGRGSSREDPRPRSASSAAATPEANSTSIRVSPSNKQQQRAENPRFLLYIYASNNSSAFFLQHFPAALHIRDPNTEGVSRPGAAGKELQSSCVLECRRK
jgi:hypothetical protein